ncbi:MAG: filamentous hemagglutinin N-terminal domain-containing protein [Opitutaceae bacterium]|nr:filamentous hemagglutinin N-terminal domain-containing protein [Opitutaceae bacterium]
MKKQSNTNLSLRKFFLALMVAGPLAVLPSSLWALPTSQANLDTFITSKSTGVTATYISNTQVNVSSTATNSVVKWNEFGSGANTITTGDTVIFNMPSTTAAILNLVDNSAGSNAATVINGTANITANGKLFIVNPNGITIGGTAVISTGGLALSTLPETEYYFLANGNLSYAGTAAAGKDITVAPGATITALAGSGDVFIASNTASDISGTINAANLKITAQGGAVNLAATGNLTVGTAPKGALTVTTAGGALDLGGAGFTTKALGGVATLTTANGAVTQNATGVLSVGDGTNAGSLTINAGSGQITVNEANGNTKNLAVSITSSNAGVATLKSTGSLTVTANTNPLTVQSVGDLTLNASTVNGALSATSTAGSIKSGGAVDTKGTAVTLLSAPAGKTISYKGVGDLTFTTITNGTAASSGVTIESTTGKVTLPAISTLDLTVTAATDIAEAPGVINSTGTAKFTAGGSIALGTSAHTLTNLIIKSAPSGATIKEADGLTVKTGTATTGDVTLTAGGAVALGTASADTISVGGKLTINTSSANAAITDGSDNVTVTGVTTLNAGSGNITLDGSLGTGVGLNSSYGQVKVTNATNATLAAKSSLNLGAITAAGNLIAYSTAGNITNSGQLKITAGTTTVGAGTAAAPGDIGLNFTAAAGSGNQMTGNISVIDDINLFTNSGATPGNYLGKSLAIVNELTTNVVLGKNVYQEGFKGDVSIKVTDATKLINNTSDLVLSGLLTLNSAGAVTANSATNAFTKVNVTAADTVNVSTSGALAVDATLAVGAAGTKTATFTAGTDLTLGTISADSGYDTLGVGGVFFDASTAGSITDSVAGGVQIYGPVSFKAKNNITVNKGGDNFGAVSLETTSDAKTIALTEANTLKLESLKAMKGTVTLISSNGDISEAATTAGITGVDDNTKTMSFTAASGKVSLLSTNNAAAKAYAVTAAGDVTIVNKTSDTTLGNIKAGGKLSVTESTNTQSILQASGTSLWSYDTTTFTVAAGGAGKITLANSGNNFGGLVLSAPGDISIKESATLNLKSVAGAKLTVASENANIIDTVDSTVTNTVIPTGTATFTANKGAITLDLSGSDYGTVSLNSSGNASIIDGVTNLTLDTSTVGGTLGVTTTAAAGTIGQAGAITATGDVTFTTSAGNISLGNTANAFGGVRFIGAAVNIAEATSFDLRGGSVATGAVTINTNGDFTSAGSSTFTNDLSISAIGSIIPGAGSLNVIGTLTVFSNNAMNLGGLSKSGNLNGKDPVFLGTGTQTPPAL